MSEYKIQDSTLTAIADGARQIGNTESNLTTAQITSILNNAYTLSINGDCANIHVEEEEDPGNPYWYHSVQAWFRSSKTGEEPLHLYYGMFNITTYWTNTTAGTSGTFTDYWYDSSLTDDYIIDHIDIGSAGDSVTMYSVITDPFHPGFGTYTTSSTTGEIPELPEPPEA